MSRYDCSGKTAYQSFKKADTIARYQRKKMGDPLHAYACPTCHKFHVGQPPAWEKSSRRPARVEIED